MPEEVAEWMAERDRKQANTGWELEYQFAGVRTLDELGALSAEEMMARWLQAQDLRQQVLREMRAAGDAFPAEMRPEDLPHVHWQVVGSVLESDTLAHDPRVRAAIQGYEGGSKPPQALSIEVDTRDGEIGRIDLPSGALLPLLEYLGDKVTR